LGAIAESLSSLSEGSPAGAATILWYAYKRLPALRRQYLHQDDLKSGVPQDSRQLRGMSLDMLTLKADLESAAFLHYPKDEVLGVLKFWNIEIS